MTHENIKLETSKEASQYFGKTVKFEWRDGYDKVWRSGEKTIDGDFLAHMERNMIRNVFLIETEEFVNQQKTFVEELRELINRHGLDNFSNTYDFLLAEYLYDMLKLYGRAKARTEELTQE